MNTESQHDQLRAHTYDGIQEYDNPMPRWWLYIFYATILFAVLSFFNVPGFGIGRGRLANYGAEMAKAREKYGALQAVQIPIPADAVILAAARNRVKRAAGEETFTTTCAACHRPDGGGNIGPNLTDDFWIHGGAPSRIFTTVANGVPDKGMPS